MTFVGIDDIAAAELQQDLVPDAGVAPLDGADG